MASKNEVLQWKKRDPGGNTVYNLRFRWPTQLAKYSDDAILSRYIDFGFSEDMGNNDEKFPEWFAGIEEPV